MRNCFRCGQPTQFTRVDRRLTSQHWCNGCYYAVVTEEIPPEAFTGQAKTERVFFPKIGDLPRAHDPETQKPTEPQPDYLWLDRQQFINLALARAKASGASFDERKVIERASIDWDRRMAAEARRLQHTRSIETMIEEPAIDSHEQASDAKLDVPRLLQSLSERKRSLLAKLFLEGYSRDEVAEAIGVSPKTVTNSRSEAISEIRRSQNEAISNYFSRPPAEDF